MEVSPKIKVLLAANHDLFAQGLRCLLIHEPVIEVLPVARSNDEVQEILLRDKPDFILMHSHFSCLHREDLILNIKSLTPVIVLVLLQDEEVGLNYDGRFTHVDGFLSVTTSATKLVETLIDIKHSAVQPKSVNGINGKQTAEKQSDTCYLTKRECEIMQLIVQGKTNARIGEILNISIFTVETHRKNVLQKLNLKGTSELVRYLLEHNL